MGNQENKPAAETSPAIANERLRTKQKPAKVAPETFVENWRTALNGKEDPVRKLRPMLITGVLGEITTEHVSQLLALLQGHPGSAERLALPLAWRERFGKLNALSRRLLDALRISFSSAIDFDQHEFVGYRAANDVEAWVVEHAPKVSGFERDIWFRRFVVCLAKDTELKTVVAGLVASAQIWMSGADKRFGNRRRPEQSFVRGLMQAFSLPSISLSKLDLAISGVETVDAQFREMLSRELNLQRQVRTQQDGINALQTQVSSLDSDLAQAREESGQRATRLSELTQLLAEADERYRLLDQHWRGVSEQELAKQSGSFREKVSQELEETLLALDRENPNMEIALRRLRRIEDILKK